MSTVTARLRRPPKNTKLLALAVAVIVGLSPASIALADVDGGDTTTAAEVDAALAEVSALPKSSAGEAAVVGDEVVVSTQVGADVSVPFGAEQGVALGTGGQALTVGLPDADQAGAAQIVDDGTVVYPSDEGVTNAVQVDETGAVALSTIIESAEAATLFPYDFELPAGASFEPQADGGVFVVGPDGGILQAIAAPTAKGADGAPIPTEYVLEGDTLMQYVGHDQPGVVYPVVADPFFIPAWAVVQIIRCGFGGWLGWIASAGWAWYGRAAAVIGGCFTGMR